jgi:hypothetical protein
MDGLDPSAKDRGLVECLTQSQVNKDLIQALIDPEGRTRWKNINSFFYYFEADFLSIQLESVLEAYPRFRKTRPPDPPNDYFLREMGSLREAWYTAKRLVADLEATPPDAEVDWEAPLPAGTHENMNKKFLARYNIELRPDFSPDENTVTRYFRALTKNKCSMKVVDMKTHKSIGTSTGLEPATGIHTIHDYYRHMRIMVNALAKAGNFATSCKSLGEGTIMAPLDVNLNYVDEAYELAIRRNSLQWLRERDTMTRTHMVRLFKLGHSQGWALQEARKMTDFHWQDFNLFSDRLKVTGKAANQTGAPISGLSQQELQKLRNQNQQQQTRQGSEGAGPGGPKRPRVRNRNRNGKGGGRGDQGRGRTPDRDRGERPYTLRDAPDDAENPAKRAKQTNLNCPQAKGKRLCRQWNAGRCNERDCRFTHNICSRRLKSGGACAGNHMSTKCNNPERVREQNNPHGH